MTKLENCLVLAETCPTIDGIGRGTHYSIVRTITYSSFNEIKYSDDDYIDFSFKVSGELVFNRNIIYDKKSQKKDYEKIKKLYKNTKRNFYDFCIIWDEDHDERIIEIVNELNKRKLLSPILFIGERKGNVSIVLNKYLITDEENYFDYVKDIITSVSTLQGDIFETYFMCLDEDLGMLINDDNNKVREYLLEICKKYNLGLLKPINYKC